MNKIYLDKNIFYIENFLDDKNFLHITKVVADKEGWYNENDVFPQRIIKDLEEKDHDQFWDYFKLKINNVFENKPNTLSKNIQGFLPYDELKNDFKEYAMPPHKDDYGYKKAHDLDPNNTALSFGCIYYINDNYEGGELLYTDKKIKIKPKANMLVVHPGSDEYEHGVLQIHNGTRFSIALFVLNNN